ncbi:unnamed protein product [Bursaphelenchus xylophilus]|uniref:(pine wood nematode) hypothetical protein n=1 Tax=Bursaphelenchus xylophilus TaxID=6326 RepID=A0A1I7RMT3_BURXY|nr:unnamed protein product [Bursaphelenchus xylophilus]CAG9125494.1 unnamed protein product [Bursaphelenchus xylophilus]
MMNAYVEAEKEREKKMEQRIFEILENLQESRRTTTRSSRSSIFSVVVILGPAWRKKTRWREAFRKL